MERVAYLDTHLVVWLYNGSRDLLSPKAARFIEENNLLISPIILLELQYLFEVEKVRVSPQRILSVLSQEIGLVICQKPFEKVIRASLDGHWTRDPFDRMVTAHAKLDQNFLITKDESIRKHYSHAVW